jgi:hypothetical protein
MYRAKSNGGGYATGDRGPARIVELALLPEQNAS